MFKFEKVKRFSDVELPCPVRKTVHSAGYDMVVAEDVIIMPATRLLDTLGKTVQLNRVTPDITNLISKMAAEGKVTEAQDMIDTLVTHTIDEVSALTKKTGCKPTLVSTGFKAYMDEGYSLDLYIRSSSPLKNWLVLANGVGVIDADYVDNPDNEGEIFFQIINLLPFPVKLQRGDIIGQAKFIKFETTDDDATFEKGERIAGFGSTTC